LQTLPARARFLSHKHAIEELLQHAEELAIVQCILDGAARMKGDRNPRMPPRRSSNATGRLGNLGDIPWVLVRLMALWMHVGTTTIKRFYLLCE
jgi:hypothetical protein